MEQHLRSYRLADGAIDLQILEEVNRFGLKGMRVMRAIIRSSIGAEVHGIRIVEYETKRVKAITAREFLGTYVAEALRMIPDMEKAFGHVDRVESVAIMMLEAMIMSYEAIDGSAFPNRPAADHVRERLRKMYEAKGVVVPE